jgi:hypothetical protein
MDWSQDEHDGKKFCLQKDAFEVYSNVRAALRSDYTTTFTAGLLIPTLDGGREYE